MRSHGAQACHAATHESTTDAGHTTTTGPLGSSPGAVVPSQSHRPAIVVIVFPVPGSSVISTRPSAPIMRAPSTWYARSFSPAGGW